MKKLAGKVALVTGAGRGIGAAIAQRLAADGAAIAINYSRSEGAARAVAERIREGGGKAALLRADVSDPGQAQQLVEATARELGKLDILVNNAATISLQPVEQIDHATMRAELATNLEGPIALLRAASPHWPKEGGRVVNITSLVQLYPFPGATVYAASKGALDAMTRIWAAELGPRGVTVNAVAAGFTDTDAIRGKVTDEMRQMFVARTPLGRIGTPSDIADVVAFLASQDARWVTGHVLFATGGFTP